MVFLPTAFEENVCFEHKMWFNYHNTLCDTPCLTFGMNITIVWITNMQIVNGSVHSLKQNTAADLSGIL